MKPMSTQTLQRPETQTGSGSPTYAHLVGPKDGKDGATRVMEARFSGTPVTALCGHVWIPGRDPKKFPVCPPCKELFDTNTDPDTGDWRIS
jgi:hypothetical protein